MPAVIPPRKRRRGRGRRRRMSTKSDAPLVARAKEKERRRRRGISTHRCFYYSSGAAYILSLFQY